MIATKKKPIQSGYIPCACRDCMEIAIRGPGQKEAYCSECVEAGCPEDQGECQAPGAYGCDDDAY